LAIAFEIAGHAAKPGDPGECSLHDPAFGQTFKTDGGSRTFDKLDPPSKLGSPKSGCKQLQKPLYRYPPRLLAGEQLGARERIPASSPAPLQRV
jgi:hypothetical protein